MPAPFDNTYNSPEHDAFVTKVKYQRTRRVLHPQHRRRRRARAARARHGTTCSGRGRITTPTWACSAITTASRGASRRIEDMTPARDRARCRRRCGRTSGRCARITTQVSRAHEARPSPATSPTRWRSPAAPGGGRSRTPRQREPAGVLRSVARRRAASTTTRHPRARRPHPRLAGVPLPRSRPRRAAPRQPLTDWELASRLSYFLWSSIPDEELRRAAAAGELRDPAALARQVQAHDRRPEGAPAGDGVLRPVARLLPLRPVSRRRHRALPRVHRRGQGGDVRRGGLVLRVHRPAATAGERDPARRLHVPEHDRWRAFYGIDGPRRRRPTRSSGSTARARSTAAACCASARC